MGAGPLSDAAIAGRAATLANILPEDADIHIPQPIIFGGKVRIRAIIDDDNFDIGTVVTD